MRYKYFTREDLINECYDLRRQLAEARFKLEREYNISSNATTNMMAACATSERNLLNSILLGAFDDRSKVQKLVDSQSKKEDES